MTTNTLTPAEVLADLNRQHAAEVLADLERQLAALGEPGDVPNTPNAQAQWAADHSRLVNRRNTIRAAQATIAKVAPELAHLTTWCADLTAIRHTIGTELLDAPRPRTDLERGRLRNLTLSIQTIDRGRGVARDSGWCVETLRVGELLRDRGYVPAPPIDNQAFGALPWFGSLPEAERRIRELQQQRDDAERQLADAVLDDAGRERLAAERRAVFAATPQRRTRGDGSQYDRYPDGREIDVEVVTS